MRRTPSSCWPSPRRRPRRCTTGSWTSAARCPCTAPGPTGSGTGASKRSEIVPLQSVGVSAYRCAPKAKKLHDDLSQAVASGWLTLAEEGSDG